MGSLYVIGGSRRWEAVTLRARRILQQVSFAVAQDAESARRLLAQSGNPVSIRTPAEEKAILGALQQGDGALLIGEERLGPADSAQRLVRRVTEQGFSVVAVPGPSRPLTALILSGLPADSFVYLGLLPPEPAPRRALLDLICEERRTLLVQGPPPPPGEALGSLLDALGDRPLAVLDAQDALWRGTLRRAQAETFAGPWVLVIGGRRGTARWEEARLRAEIEARLAQGASVKEISRQLAAPSGWPRRQVYRLAVELTSVDLAPAQRVGTSGSAVGQV